MCILPREYIRIKNGNSRNQFSYMTDKGVKTKSDRTASPEVVSILLLLVSPGSICHNAHFYVCQFTQRSLFAVQLKAKQKDQIQFQNFSFQPPDHCSLPCLKMPLTYLNFVYNIHTHIHAKWHHEARRGTVFIKCFLFSICLIAKN